MEHKLLLQAIASQAAIAVENVQLQEGGSLEQRRMLAILENAAGPILLLDNEFRLLELSPMARTLFLQEDIQRGKPLERGHGYDPLIDLFDESKTTQKTTSGLITWSDKVEFKAFISPIEDGGYVVHLHDNSHGKFMDKSKNDLITTTTHDLKNPLTLISLTSELIQKAGPLNEKQVELINRICTTVKNMDGLLQSLLELAILDEVNSLPGQKEVDLNALVSDITDDYQLFAQTRQQTLQLEEANIPPMVQGNPFQLRHAISNLVDNAIKYTPAGGAIFVFIETSQKDVLIRVKDNGYGISAEDLPFIFDRFFRVR